jgi:SecD/SecF fusion protein
VTENIGFRWVVIAGVIGLATWASIANWPLNLGIDLAGGNTITYSIDPAVLDEFIRGGGDLETAMEQSIKIIATRIDQLGVKDLSVRREGRDRILIQAPRLSEEETAEIKRRMVQLGDLKFLIGLGGLRGGGTDALEVPSRVPGAFETYTFDEAAANAQRSAAIEAGLEKVRAARAAGQPIPRDAYLDGTSYQLEAEPGRPLPIFWKPFAPSVTARQLNIPESAAKVALANAAAGREYNPAHIKGGWLYADPKFYSGGPNDRGFSGRDILAVARSTDRMGLRAVSYRVRTERQSDFARYTNKYLKRPMAIVLNDEIWTWPTIDQELRDSVQIYNHAGFSKEEQDWLVNCLQSGSLQLRPRLEGEDKIAAALGEEAVSRGVMSTILSAVLIFAFMVVYYRFSGLVAILTLTMNLGLTIAVMALFRATLTLPGVAGLVLTIGMAVDANILIFERIREELQRGRSLLAGAQAGFDRAFVTIIDSNLTTIITAIALYNFGVGPIKGFAVTLMAGMVCSLFTAIFVAKTVFATVLGAGIVRKLPMMRLLPDGLHLDFLRHARTWVIISSLAILGSVVLFAGSGDSKYGLDFTGGYVVRMNLKDSLTTADVSAAVAGIRTAEGAQKYPQSEPTALRDSAGERPSSYHTFDIKIQSLIRASEATITERVHADLRTILGPALERADRAVYDEPRAEWKITFRLASPMSRDDLGPKLGNWKDARGQTPYDAAHFEHLDSEERRGQVFAREWRIGINEKTVLGHEILDDLQAALGSAMFRTPDGAVDEGATFAKLSYVGPNVVADLKANATIAILVSLVGIILYIWLRFKELKYGVAAAAATFHDAIIAVGAVVLFNGTGLVHVPINLPIIAGFLTIMGYSLNDTIVQFDRVRENLGNVSGSFRDVVNLSINQTLARTVLTAITTFVTVVVLFAANMGQESGIEGIAFCLLVGVLVGTYSTIYVASPVLVWLHEREGASGATRPAPKARVTAG